MDMPDSAKVALVTGGNRGIGLEIVRQLAEKGVTVLLAGRVIQEAEQAAASLNAVGLTTITPVRLDITSLADRVAVSQLIAREFGRLDIVVNNAGVATPEGAGTLSDPLTSGTSLDELRQVFETNIFAVIRLTHELLPLLRNSGGARIVNVSSQLGSLTLHARKDRAVAYNKRYAYNASKAALNLFTIQLAQELEGTKIKVNSVHPGWVKTRLGSDAAPLQPAQGAQTVVKAALLDEDGPSGTFFHLDQTIPW
jgi:NAD(P)-dependent dehydrogenase (short-subunit alcohol dehydrogenase family)